MTVAGALAAGLAAVLLVADVDTSKFRYERTLEAPADAPVRFEPDGPIYAHSKVDFADLRILDAGGMQVPWRPEPLPDAVAPQSVRLVARGRLGEVVSVVVDRGPAPKVIDRIELDIPDRDFVGDVEILGSTTGAEGSYATLSTTQIYAVRGAVDARSTTAVFPATDVRFLLVRARGVSAIAGGRVARDPKQPSLVPVPARSRRSETDRTTVVRLDLGFANVPVDGVQIRSTTDRFVRTVTVEGSNDGRGFVSVGEGEVARFRGVSLSRIAVSARHRYLRVTIRNADDAALEALRVTAEARPRPLLLAGGHRPPFTLLYGAADVPPPEYDFARLPPAATGFDRAREGALGAERANAAFEPPADTRTFFERNRRAVEALLVLAAIVVAGGGVLALRRRV